MQKIMIIDDEIDILSMLARYFRLNGYVVLTAENTIEAQKKLAQQPDLILLDINMPEMDGISFCKNIRDYVSCPILFLTANTDDRNKISGFSAGGVTILLNPFRLMNSAHVFLRIFAERTEQKQRHRFYLIRTLLLTFRNGPFFIRKKRFRLLKRNLILLKYCLKTPDRFSTRNGYMKRLGDLKAWATTRLLRST